MDDRWIEFVLKYELEITDHRSIKIIVLVVNRRSGTSTGGRTGEKHAAARSQ